MKLINTFIGFFKLSGTEKKIVNNEILLENMQRVFYISLVTIPLNIIHIILFGLKLVNSAGIERQWRLSILISHIVILLTFTFVAIFYHFFTFKPEKSNKLASLSNNLVMVFLLMIGAVIASIDQMVTSAITPFLVTCIGAGLIILTRPLYSLFFFLSAYIVFYFMIPLVQLNADIVFSNRANGLSSMGLGLFLSFILWRVKLNNIKQKGLIEQSNERLAIASKAGGVGIWEYDITGNSLIWDEQVYHLYGITPNMFNSPFEARLAGIHPDDQVHVDNEIQMAIRGEKDYDTEFRVIWADGSIHYIRAIASVHRSGSGEVLRMIGTNWDITNRKKVEQTLLDREALYRAILNASPDIITVTDLKGQILLTSPISLKMFGHASDEVINHSIFDYLDKSEYAKARENITKVFQGIPRDSAEYKAVRADGSTFDIEINAELVRDLAGQPFQMVFVTRDITKRKQADEKQRESEKQYRLVVETAQEGILVAQNGLLKLVNPILTKMTGYSEEELHSIPFLEFIYPNDRDLVKDNYLKRIAGWEVDQRYHLRLLRKDKSLLWVELSGIKIDWEGQPATLNFISDITERKQAEDQIVKLAKGIEQSPVSIVITNVDGDIEFVNPKFCELSGYPIEEAIGKNSRMLKSGQTTIDYYQNLWNTILSGKEWHGEFFNKKKNGDFYWEMASISPIINVNGEITNFIAVKEDITKEKENEAILLKAKHEAEAANKAKSKFLANMSHEIRTPLNAIIGYSQLMDRDKLLTGQSKEYATSINRAGEYLLSLINDILELSKAEAGRVELNPTNFNLHTMLNDLNLIFKERVKSKHIQLNFETAPGVPHYVFADEGKLRQIFINLIGNAVKFTDEGSVVVNTRFDKVNNEKSFLEVEISDSGPGIPQNEMEKLFRIFEQTSSGMKKGSGTGLGLALSRELAIIMGGNINVHSEVGKGSVFTFNVEISENLTIGIEEKIDRKVIGLVKGEKDYQVLIVDDNEENLRLAVNFLRLTGFITIEASNGKEAIDKFGENFPDLVLMDLRMPVMDGYEAVQHIRATQKGSVVPIVALSANTFEDEERDIKNLDIQGYIHKPFREDELFGTIGKVLGIQYVYEEEIPKSATEVLYDDVAIARDIGNLPAEILFRLQDTVEIADSDQIATIFESFGIHNQRLAQHLTTMSNNFEWEYLQQLLKNRNEQKSI